jgi:hypothetical protein
LPNRGFGKSIIFLIREELKLASLIIMPLNLLQEEQAEKLKTIAGAHPFVLNGDTNTIERIVVRSVRVSIHTVSVVICG